MGGGFEKEKELASREAIKYIQDNMVVGIGSGSTIVYFIKLLGEKVRGGLNIVAIPTSNITAELCKMEGISIITTSIPKEIDIDVDGADEFDKELRLIKGGGGCLLHEKIVLYVAKKKIIIVDSRKKVDTLGKVCSIPVEVIPFSWIAVYHKIKSYGANLKIRLKQDKSYFITEEGNYILDCKFENIQSIEELDNKLSSIPGLVEHGIFLNLADEVIMGIEDRVNVWHKK